MIIRLDDKDFDTICSCLDDYVELFIRNGNLEMAQEYEKLLQNILYSGGLHELNIHEWEEWKKKPNRDPICILYKDTTTPLWITDPKEINEPALLVGWIKLFNKKPTNTHIKFAKWKEIK